MGKRNTSRNNKTGIKTKKSRPDQVEKLLEEWNDVFADIIIPWSTTENGT